MLSHELYHAYNWLFDPDGYKRRMITPNNIGKEQGAPFGNEEEFYATSQQNQVNKVLGEAYRPHYGGKSIIFSSATAKKPK